MTNLRTFADSVGNAMAIVVWTAVFYFALRGATGTAWRWLTSGVKECGEIPCPTCGQSVIAATTENTIPKPARRSLNPYREIRRLKQEVADAVACRDETQRLLEMQYVSMVEVVKAVNYMSTTGIAIQTKVGKA